MALELLFNVVLLLFFIYNFINVGGVEPPKMPGTINGSEYARALLAILIVFIIINIVKIYGRRTTQDTFKINFDIKKFLTNKLFIGSAILLIYSLALDTVGFIIASFVMFLCYSYLLGQRNIPKLILSAVVSVVVLYLIFDVLLGIILPRGTGIFRNFSMMIERFI